MLNIEELELLINVIDETNDALYNSDDNELLQKIRSKLSDMILVQRAWNTGKCIVMESGVH